MREAKNFIKGDSIFLTVFNQFYQGVRKKVQGFSPLEPPAGYGPAYNHPEKCETSHSNTRHKVVFISTQTLLFLPDTLHCHVI